MKIQPTALPITQSPEEKAKKIDGQLREASQMYENHFLNEMVKAMRSTVRRDDGLLKHGMAEKFLNSSWISSTWMVGLKKAESDSPT